jgi:hypothetical protein
VRNAEGNEKKTSAVAHATETAERSMAWYPIEGEEEETIEKMIVITVSRAPDTKVRRVSSGVLIRGDKGFGKDALVAESAVLRPVIMDQPVAGNGEGMASIQVIRAR